MPACQCEFPLHPSWQYIIEGGYNWYPGPFMPFNFHRNCKAKLGSGRWSILSSSKGGASIPGRQCLFEGKHHVCTE